MITVRHSPPLISAGACCGFLAMLAAPPTAEAQNPAGTANAPQVESRVAASDIDVYELLESQTGPGSVFGLNASGSSATTSGRGTKLSFYFDGSAGYSTNLLSAISSQGGAVQRSSLPVTLSFGGTTHHFEATYKPTLTHYSGAVSDAVFSQSYQQGYAVQLSGRSNFTWQLSAARLRDIGQLLPSVLSIGGTSVVQPPAGAAQQTASSTSVQDVSTSLTFDHATSERQHIRLTGVGSWHELSQAAGTNQPLQTVRSIPAGADLFWERLVAPSVAFSVDGSFATIGGLTSQQRLSFETVLVGTRVALAQNDRLLLRAGPMFRHTAVLSNIPIDNSPTYALSADLRHQTPRTTLDAAYARSLQVNANNTISLGHMVSGSFGRTLTRTLSMNVDVRYFHSVDAVTSLPQNTLGATSRWDYRFSERIGLFFDVSQSLLTQVLSSNQPATMHRTDLTSGIRLWLTPPPSKD
ncbi:hypothetical protein [Terriglobus roseus]|uniref:Beta-barrel porin 2 n=1 Tax=Terriglobus roseus TaxID=392734 RepID=A0A1H4SJC4_9BACT|nr:hypothetical protein [Terriglobus roseus]SEC44295.1 hypothetical protein SAMN05443244_3472 [Terriglobus roseus]